MFVQIISGKVKDADLLRRQGERWMSEVKPSAKGYLGYTGGQTPDGRCIDIVRFESRAAAMKHSESEQQSAWWNEYSKGFDGEPTFIESEDVDTPMGGGSNDAGFIQVIQGRAVDRAGMQSRVGEMEADLRKLRPDILGMLIAWHGDGNDFTQAVYFKDEAGTRKLEKETESNEMREEYQSLFAGEPTFYDLTEPVLD